MQQILNQWNELSAKCGLCSLCLGTRHYSMGYSFTRLREHFPSILAKLQLEGAAQPPEHRCDQRPGKQSHPTRAYIAPLSFLRHPKREWDLT